ncbi:MAG: 3-hydroxyacyl-ACP dehydratase FabZ [Desulfovibrio sp.]
MKKKDALIDITKIMELLPHRYPFLLVDRVVEIEAGERIEAFKNVTMNEPFFQGHFPGLPIMPGVLILEALAQAGGILVLNSIPVAELSDKVFLFTGINKVKFRQPVVPGDKLVLTVTDIRCKMNIWRMHGVATVDGKVAAEGDFSAAVVAKENM